MDNYLPTDFLIFLYEQESHKRDSLLHNFDEETKQKRKQKEENVKNQLVSSYGVGGQSFDEIPFLDKFESIVSKINELLVWYLRFENNSIAQSMADKNIKLKPDLLAPSLGKESPFNKYSGSTKIDVHIIQANLLHCFNAIVTISRERFKNIMEYAEKSVAIIADTMIEGFNLWSGLIQTNDNLDRKILSREIKDTLGFHLLIIIVELGIIDN